MAAQIGSVKVLFPACNDPRDQPAIRVLVSASVHHRRADELRDSLAAWEGQGHSASLVTITVPHDLDDPLSKLVEAERAA